MDDAQLTAKADRLIDRWQIEDPSFKQSMAFMVIGMKMIHYGVARMTSHVADKTDTEDLREQIIERTMQRMRKLSMEGFQSENLLENLDSLEEIIRNDLKAEQKRTEQRREVELRLGIPTPFEQLNTTLNGGLKAGKVVLVHGKSPAVFKTMAGLYRHILRQRVPITHFGTAAEKDMPEMPGVKNIPGSFWKGQGMSLTKIRAAFEVADGYVALVDRLDWLMDLDDRSKSTIKRRQVVLKYLVKTAKRYKISIVVGHVTYSDDDVIPEAAGVVRLPVCERRIGDKDVMVAGDEIFVEESDGKIRILGGGDDASPGLGEPDGGTDGPQQLEGSEEDRSKDSGVEADGGEQERGVSAGEDAGSVDAAE